MKNFEQIGIVELNSQEIKDTNGGLWWVPVLALLGSMINDAQNNPDDFRAGFNAASHTHQI